MSFSNPMALPLAIVAVAFAVSFYVIRTLSDDREQSKKTRSERIKHLLGEKKALKKALKAEMKDAQSEDERKQLLEKGREILAELEALQDPRTPPKKSSPKGIWVFILLVSALFIGGSVVLVQQQSQERMDDAETTARLAHMKLQKELAGAKETLESDPDNIDALAILARRSLLDGDLPTAMTHVMRADEASPNHPKITIYSGAMAVMVGMSERALERILPVASSHPEDHEAQWWLGVAYSSMTRFDEALLHLQNAVTLAPESEEAAYAKGMIAEIETAMNVEIHASGVVTLPEDITPPETGILFVAALRAPVDGGPPLAAARFPRFSFPMKFSLSAANMPMGGEWPEEFWMRVRIDADGDPMTKSEEDLKTQFLGPFKRGVDDLEIALSPE